MQEIMQGYQGQLLDLQGMVADDAVLVAFKGRHNRPPAGCDKNVLGL